MGVAKTIPSKESQENRIYNEALKISVDEKAILLEAGQGKNVNGNVFAILKYVRLCNDFDDYKVRLSLVPEKNDDARLKLANYGIRDVDFVEFGGEEYRRALATSKYLITDNSFPAYFYKRPEQLYLNTWHGTPLKTLGMRDIKNAVSIGNVQANMAKADYLLHPNSFTKDIMMKDFSMEHVFKHKTLVMDYPRNDAFYKTEYKQEIEEKYALRGKRKIAYMPTWRGISRDTDAEEQIRQTQRIIGDISGKLKKDEILFVNLHFLLGNRIDFSEYDNVCCFPAEYETYDFLAICDVLITDYSSVSIDFAATGRDIILYLYDYDQYKKDKGFYLDVKELPFKRAESIEELEKALHSEAKAYKLDTDLVSNTKGRASELLVKLMLTGDEEGLDTDDYAKHKDAASIAYFENINSKDSLEHLRGLDDESVIMFPNNINEKTVKTLLENAADHSSIKISGRLYCTNAELRILRLYKRFGIFKKKAADIYAREAARQIANYKYEKFEVKQCNNSDRQNIFRALNIV